MLGFSGLLIFILFSFLGIFALIMFFVLQRSRQQTQAVNAEKFEIFFRTVDALPVTVVITDRNGTIEYVNRKFSDLTQYSFEEAVGKNSRILKSNAHEQEFYKSMWKTILTGSDWHGTFCNKKKNGELFYERVSILSIKDEQGKISHFVGIKEDITEEKRITDELKKAKIAAEQANKAKSVFLSSIGHEFRTPLNAILGFSQLLEEDEKLPLEITQKGYIKNILKSGYLLLELINDVIDLVQIEAGIMDMFIESVEPCSVINEVINEIKDKANTRNIEILTEYPAGQDMFILADRIMLRQIIRHLISNAVKFSPVGENVKIYCEKTEKNILRINIMDRGPGIPKEKLDYIFEPFDYHGETQYSVKGLGIGLPIAKKMVKQMNGSIGFSTTADEGSTFYVDFPLAPRLTEDI